MRAKQPHGYESHENRTGETECAARVTPFVAKVVADNKDAADDDSGKENYQDEHGDLFAAQRRVLDAPVRSGPGINQIKINGRAAVRGSFNVQRNVRVPRHRTGPGSASIAPGQRSPFRAYRVK